MALRDRVVLVTGAASGIGRACAREFSRRGADLILADIDGDGARQVADACGNARSYEVDVTDPNALADLAEDAGHVDILFNNAGVAVAAPLTATATDDWDWVLGVNLRGPIALTRLLLPAMLERGSGHIVTTASIAGLVAAPGMIAYTTSKFGIVGFSDALRLEVEPRGVKVSVVCPGFVRTGLAAATRYRNDGFKAFLSEPPAWYGLDVDAAATRIADGIENGKPLITLGPERLGWYLKRLSPELAHRLTRAVAKRFGVTRE